VIVDRLEYLWRVAVASPMALTLVQVNCDWIHGPPLVGSHQIDVRHC
jgi:hypothetical protein